jgi:predicted nucleic acid-binding protein
MLANRKSYCQQLRSDLDGQAGRREEARRLGVEVTGTLGVLARCAQLGSIDLPTTWKELQGASFRIPPRLIRELLKVHYAKQDS